LIKSNTKIKKQQAVREKTAVAALQRSEVQNFLRRFTDASAYRATKHNSFFYIPNFSVAPKITR